MIRSCLRPLGTLGLALGLAGAAEPPATVYRFTDPNGIEHYVDQLDEVPAGIRPKRVDLDAIPLNPETAKALKDAAERAAERPREQGRAPTGTDGRDSPPHSPPAPPPAGLTGVSRSSVGLSVLFAVLTLLRRQTRITAPGATTLFGLIRRLAGALALVGWVGVAYELRDSAPWLSDHLPPLRSLTHAREATDRAAAQHNQELDRALKTP